MLKAAGLVTSFVLLIFAFCAGVIYSDNMKSNASWMFETAEKEVKFSSKREKVKTSPKAEEVELSVKKQEQLPTPQEEKVKVSASVESSVTQDSALTNTTDINP